MFLNTLFWRGITFVHRNHGGIMNKNCIELTIILILKHTATLLRDLTYQDPTPRVPCGILRYKVRTRKSREQISNVTKANSRYQSATLYFKFKIKVVQFKRNQNSDNSKNSFGFHRINMVLRAGIEFWL